MARKARTPDLPSAETCASFAVALTHPPFRPADSLRAKSRHCSVSAQRLIRNRTRASNVAPHYDGSRRSTQSERTR